MWLADFLLKTIPEMVGLFIGYHIFLGITLGSIALGIFSGQFVAEWIKFKPLGIVIGTVLGLYIALLGYSSSKWIGVGLLRAADLKDE